MEERLHLLYKGERITRQNFSVYIPLGKQLRPGGYAIGLRDSLTMPQARPVVIAGKPISEQRDYFWSSESAIRQMVSLRPQPEMTTPTETETAQEIPPQENRRKAVKKRVKARH